ncbi:transcriptional repressor LexA [Oleiagrimonas sp. C23AA]|uniref:transcriptional repressor LexA n=1 Tax=Oleiagrimonas sp. C23AA TaxID=2719047 RepID=UPI0014211836|nr:transcriptional repressor LexA [Oleiagrimonas sp. C23AA]NII09405.1 transcriptional repressor LexA [Oleiagrimonas sp. C23AA]
MSTTALSHRQHQVLAFVRDYVNAEGRPPTLREIADSLGFPSHSSAQSCITSLVNKGVLERSSHHRGLRLPDAPSWHRQSIELPLVGRVAAGAPILAAEHIERQVEVDPALFRPQADYLLRVVGLSMRNVGIFDGDMIAVHRTPQAENGQIVVARIDEEVTVKRLRRERDHLLLLPENEDFEPIVVEASQAESFAIEGRCVGVIRSL